jgi:hypothetical protein
MLRGAAMTPVKSRNETSNILYLILKLTFRFAVAPSLSGNA